MTTKTTITNTRMVDIITMETVINDSGFHINDIVTVRNYGQLYDSYSHAMETLWGKKWNGFFHDDEQYPTGLISRNDLYSVYIERNDSQKVKYWRNKNWRIAGMIMHENGHAILCQLIDELKRSILIGVDGLEIVKHNPKNNTPRVPKLPRS